MKTFKCRVCDSTRIEEVLEGVTQYSVVIGVALDDNEEPIIEYGSYNTEGGDTDSIRFQCVVCGEEVSKEELIALAN